MNAACENLPEVWINPIQEVLRTSPSLLIRIPATRRLEPRVRVRCLRRRFRIGMRVSGWLLIAAGIGIGFWPKGVQVMGLTHRVESESMATSSGRSGPFRGDLSITLLPTIERIRPGDFAKNARAAVVFAGTLMPSTEGWEEPEHARD